MKGQNPVLQWLTVLLGSGGLVGLIFLFSNKTPVANKTQVSPAEPAVVVSPAESVIVGSIITGNNSGGNTIINNNQVSVGGSGLPVQGNGDKFNPTLIESNEYTSTNISPQVQPVPESARSKP